MFGLSHVADPARDRRLLAGSLALLAGTAWLALGLWTGSPYGRFLHHVGAGLAIPVEVALFSVGWTLMIVAMMLPSTIPLVVTFGAIVRSRHRPALLVGLVIAGYLLVWSAFGVATYLLDRLVHAGVDAWPWLAAHPQIIPATAFGVAGAWQFSPLKYRCLDACRSPLGFVLGHWRGERPTAEALRLGMAHGAFCIGCCWSLMLVMFGVGLGSLAWMLAIGALTAVEKHVSWGHRIGRPVGVVLALTGVAVLSS